MAAFMKEAHNYFVALYPTPKGDGRINLYCLDGFRLYLIFQASPTETATYNAATKTGVAYVNVTAFPYYVDLVRNEKPVLVTFNPDSTPPSFVVHANEPVGDGDI